MVEALEYLTYVLKNRTRIKEHWERKVDREKDRIIYGNLTGSRVKSELIDLERITENEVVEAGFMSYPEILREIEEKVEASNREEENAKIRVHEVINVDTGRNYFNSVNGKVRKITLQLGNNTNPEFNILFISGVHGEESRLWRAGLEAVLQLARLNEAKEKLLRRGQITFDLLSDIFGADNQTRGYVDRSGRQVNAPLILGYQHNRNPFGLGDRNSEQGRNSEEAKSVLTRSNHAHYRKVCGQLTWVSDHHETNENSQYPSHFFRYGGIMLMAHIYFTLEELHLLNRLKRCLTFTQRVRKIINDFSPLKDPIFREQVLYNHPTMRKLRKIRDRIRRLGQRTFEDIYESAMLYFPHVERDLALDESIWTGGEMFRLPGILLGPDILAYEGLTSESFQQDLMVRLKQTLALIEAQLMVIGLNYKEEEDDSYC